MIIRAVQILLLQGRFIPLFDERGQISELCIHKSAARKVFGKTVRSSSAARCLRIDDQPQTEQKSKSYSSKHLRSQIFSEHYWLKHTTRLPCTESVPPAVAGG